MMLPKGTFKGLARVSSPIWLWMAAGWAAYPRMIGFISDRMGESLDIAEVEAFSMVMVPACIIAGVALAIYGFAGKSAGDAEIVALGREKELCPFCGAEVPEGAGQCQGCQNKLLK